MEKEKIESVLIDYIDGKLSELERKSVEQELAHDASVRKLYEQLIVVIGALDKAPNLAPGSSLKINFNEALKKEIASQPKGRQVTFRPIVYRAAAAIALVMIGVGIGFWINKNQRQQAELEALHREMDATRHMMMAMLDNQQSASQRVLGASVAFKMDKADDQIVSALVKAMNEDPNTNVRMAALEALGKFNQQEHVRHALISSLATQKDPVVQIALIQLLVRMKEKSVVKELEKIVDDNGTIKPVKDEAYTGILKLS